MDIQYNILENGPIDEIDAAIFSGDTMYNRERITQFRSQMARWERGLAEIESVLDTNTLHD